MHRKANEGRQKQRFSCNNLLDLGARLDDYSITSRSLHASQSAIEQVSHSHTLCHNYQQLWHLTNFDCQWVRLDSSLIGEPKYGAFLLACLPSLTEEGSRPRWSEALKLYGRGLSTAHTSYAMNCSTPKLLSTDVSACRAVCRPKWHRQHHQGQANPFPSTKDRSLARHLECWVFKPHGNTSDLCEALQVLCVPLAVSASVALKLNDRALPTGLHFYIVRNHTKKTAALG